MSLPGVRWSGGLWSGGLVFGVIFLSLVLTQLAVPPGARADEAFRCSLSGRVVDLGDSESDVREKCGAPTAVDTQITERRWKGRTITGAVDVWTYNMGPTRFVRVLRFQQKVLTQILIGDYGS